MMEQNAAKTDTAQDWRIVIARDDWDRALKQILGANVGANGSWSVLKGAVRRLPHHNELLYEYVDGSPSPPHGDSFPSLEVWGVVRLRTDRTIPMDEELLQIEKQIQPRRYQLCLVVLIDPDQPDQWRAALWNDHRQHPIQSISIVGGRPLRLSDTETDPMDANEMAEDVADRWSRTIGAVGTETFHVLQRSRVLLVGTGRIGSATAFHLAALGIRHLALIDPDTLQMHNLDAMPMANPNMIGQRKAELLGNRLSEFRPNMSCSIVNKDIRNVSARRLLEQRYDLYVTCVDDDLPRLAVRHVSNRTFTPHLDIAASVQSGSITADARLIVPPDGGCLVCVGGLDGLEALESDLVAPPGMLQRRPRPGWRQQRAGSLITINSMVVGAGVQIWLDLLSGKIKTSFWQRLSWETASGLRAEGAEVTGDADCRYCK